MNPTLEAAAAELIGGPQEIAKILRRSDDAVDWALIHSGRLEGLEMDAHAITSLMQSAVLLTGCGAPDLAGHMRIIAAFFVTMIECEQDIQKTLSRPRK